MKTYLIVYNVHYKEISTPEETIEEMKDNLEQIKRIKERDLIESIYNMTKWYWQSWYKTLSENLIIECDLKGEKLLEFINKKIKAKWPCNEKQYLEIGIENIINLD